VKRPLIVVNFKAYSEVCGERGIQLARDCKTVSEETGVEIIACPQMVDLANTIATTGCTAWSQSVDDVTPGGRTGHTTVEAVAGAGASGTLINHSECRKLLFDMEDLVVRCRDNRITTCVCTNNLGVSKAAASLGPDYVAIEPPELIGGDVSVTSADPGIVSKTVDELKNIDGNVSVLCGAGVKNSKDISKAVELGAEGVLLASGVVKSKDPKAVLRELTSAF